MSDPSTGLRIVWRPTEPLEEVPPGFDPPAQTAQAWLVSLTGSARISTDEAEALAASGVPVEDFEP